MKPDVKKKIYNTLEKMDDDELAPYYKIYHNPRDLKAFEESAVWALVASTLDINVEEYTQPVQQMAKEIAKNRKIKEMKEDEKRRKATRKRSIEILNELKPRIQIKSRHGARPYITDDGKLVWPCPGTFTDSQERTQKCDVVLEMSMVEDTPPKQRFFAATSKYQIEAGEGKTREPSITKLKGKGAAEAVTTMSRGGNAPIIGDLTMKGFVEELIVLRCPKCSVADDLKLTLKEK